MKIKTLLFLRLCALFFGFMFVFSCAYPIKEKTLAEIKKGIEQRASKAESLVQAVREKPLLIGHMAGLKNCYPKNEEQIRSGEVLDISLLMDLSFLKLGLNAIEMDLQMIKGKMEEKDEVYITHDPLGEKSLYDPKTLNYLKRNSLEKVLQHFFRKGYEKDKMLFLEIKIGSLGPLRRWKSLSANNKKLIRRALEIIRKSVGALAKERRKQAFKSIAFVSFNFKALEFLKKSEHQKFFILVHHLRWKRQELIKSKWLTGIWFDPKAPLGNIGAKFFVELERKRRERKLKALQLHLSLYYAPWKYYDLHFQGTPYQRQYSVAEYENVHGFIFDAVLEGGCGRLQEASVTHKRKPKSQSRPSRRPSSRPSK